MVLMSKGRKQGMVLKSKKKPLEILENVGNDIKV